MIVNCDARFIVVVWIMALASPLLVIMNIALWARIKDLELQLDVLWREKIARARQFAEHRQTSRGE